MSEGCQDRRELLARALLFVLGLLCTYWILDLALLGFDAWPLIATGRWQGSSDLVRLFSSELMEGRYQDGHFHRPLVHLSFALDHALFGTYLPGYHLTNLLACLVSSQLLFTLARRFTKATPWAAFAAALFFLAHPLQLEVLPFPARRADNLALLFILLTLTLLPRPSTVLRPGRALLLFLSSACAFASKETGAILALLAPLALLLEARPLRLLPALRRSVPVQVALSGAFFLRQSVLTGLAGHADSGLAAVFSLPLGEYLWRVLYSQPLVPWGALTLPALALCAALLSFFALRGQEARSSLLVLSWWLVLLLVSSLAGRVHDWYALLFVPPTALLGLLAFNARRALAGAFLLPWFLAALLSGPLVARFENLLEGSRLQKDLEARLDKALASGTGTTIDPFVSVLPPRPDGAGLRLVPMLQDYSVRAYFEVHDPERTWTITREGSRLVIKP